MRLTSCISLFFVALASGSFAAPALESQGHIPIHARWIKPSIGTTTTTASTGEQIHEDYAELLIKKAVEANAEKMGLKEGAWTWSGFLPSSTKIVEYPGLQMYKGKSVLAAYIVNPPKGAFPSSPQSVVRDMKSVTMRVDPRDGEVVYLSAGGKSLL
ncbi:hypothetical protein D9757_009891 [Collybiopsis confluens]|uniref:Uncharacterized protein n=1 Tax=Collybiopsis confluens TaxID=2823264 RepID=A0A8H5LVM4_9AGAR|nr:hypothetical protein D9757_009891 [Collybiopsis confluens]